MRHEILCLAALLVAGSPSMAAEGEYPAANFEPEVIYQAETATSPAEPVTATDPDYPAAAFTPQVIYQDPELIEKVGPQAVPETPAAPAVSAPPKDSGNPAVQRAPRPQGTPGDVSPPYTALLIALGVIALAFWWSRREAAPAGEAAVEVEEAPEAGDTEAAADPEAEAAAAEAEEEVIEELAEDAEAQLRHQNRQRANKTKRTRRR
ncbi:hypothetical protein MIT9_P0512 [Methylomarinovum caldicuralii]|uniref:MYXO-CTERM domain-containing protein n=1 Tax=Methylomarinovum caldicuralii TaxID=438856 RepID=A0AAU9C1H0_9GAMM|nr:hypothetical protein [Methylomarinovum caldicuralii]BCX80934.1 hypothetical protein MIT9_P0512 [Methylomarinovum caldicuralii]